MKELPNKNTQLIYDLDVTEISDYDYKKFGCPHCGNNRIFLRAKTPIEILCDCSNCKKTLSIKR